MPREVARILIRNGREELLLLRYDADYAVSSERPLLRHYWVPPGGARAGRESFEEAALRELREETGLQVEGALHHVWDRATRFSSGGTLVEQHERYFFAAEPVAGGRVSTHDTEEQISGHRWWPLPDLLASDEVFFPARLPQLFEDLLVRGVPDGPPRRAD